MNKKAIGISIALISGGVLIGCLLMIAITPHLLNIPGTVGVDVVGHSIHGTITMYKDNQVCFKSAHPGVLTDLGRNFTLAKICGDSGYNTTLYMLNATYISIGNQGSLSNSSTELPGEWNRTAGTVEDITATGVTWSFNLTCTFYPDSGPYTADCIGINYESGIGNNALFGYDTFSEVTNIDDSFTITVEFQVSITYS